jgi:hypothetical protein
VEEQFYLIWPLLLLLTAWAWRRPGRFCRVTVPAGLAGLFVASFAGSVLLTSAAQPWAFFSLPTRAWELGVGAAVALAAPRLSALARPVAAALGWIGAAMIVWAVTEFSTSTAFPGLAALLPVVGTAAIVTAGCASSRSGPARVLRIRPLQAIGSVSYSWYLWHWPVLLLAPATVTEPLVGRLALAAFSGLLALVTLRTVENPIRFPSGRLLHARTALMGGGAITAFAVAVAGTTAVAVKSPQGSTAVAPTRALPAPVDAPADRRANEPEAAAATSPINPVDAVTAPVIAEVARSVTARNVPANLRPALPEAHADKARPFVDGCHVDYRGSRSPRCAYGSTDAATTIVLFGDSHATQWFPALEALASVRGWRLEVLTKTTCPPFELSLTSPVLKRDYRECDAWRADALDRIRAERPAVVLLGAARHYEARHYGFQVYGPEWTAGLTETVRQIRAAGAAAIVLGQTPKPTVDVPSCLSEHLTSMTGCTTPTATAVSPDGAQTERAAAGAAGAHYVDTPRWICTPEACAVAVGDLLVYRDDNHLTTAYAGWLAPALAAEIDVALAPQNQQP